MREGSISSGGPEHLYRLCHLITLAPEIWGGSGVKIVRHFIAHFVVHLNCNLMQSSSSAPQKCFPFLFLAESAASSLSFAILKVNFSRININWKLAEGGMNLSVQSLTTKPNDFDFLRGSSWGFKKTKQK